MSSSPQTEESLLAHVGRVCKNAFTKCFGAVQTSDEYAKIKYKEHLIDARKKKFGVDFLALVHANADDATKQQCIDTVLEDTAKIEAEIAALKAEIERVNKATNEKIVAKPGAPAAAAPATAATASTPAPAPAPAPAAVEMPPAPAPAPAATENVGVEVSAPTTTGEDPTMQEVPLSK